LGDYPFLGINKGKIAVRITVLTKIQSYIRKYIPPDDATTITKPGAVLPALQAENSTCSNYMIGLPRVRAKAPSPARQLLLFNARI